MNQHIDAAGAEFRTRQAVIEVFNHVRERREVISKLSQRFEAGIDVGTLTPTDFETIALALAFCDLLNAGGDTVTLAQELLEGKT